MIEFIQESNPQELPEGELKELVDLGNVRWKTLRLRFWGGGAAFYVHGAHDDDIGGVSIGDNNVDNLMLMAMIIIIVKRMIIIISR